MEYFISINAIHPSKGVHEAVKFTKKIGARLFLIGPIKDHEYFKTLAKYFGKDVVYLGEVDENTKRSLLCKAKALVFPVIREEYFGLNMVEAMACGTPVLAFNRGAVSEIVQHGETGFLGSSIEELIKYVPALDMLNPAIIREHAKRFSSRNMALKYARIYKMILEEKMKKPTIKHTKSSSIAGSSYE
jgi:glycosyltransferase involved in cell wall biosynthesis